MTKKRICRRCKQEKDKSEFGKDNHRMDKTSVTCKACRHDMTMSKQIPNLDDIPNWKEKLAQLGIKP